MHKLIIGLLRIMHKFKYKILYYLSLIIILFLGKNAYAEQFDLKTPLKGQSIASQLLQLDTLKAVYPMTSSYNKSCQYYSISNTKLIHNIKDSSVKNGQYMTGYWQEAWTVNRCGQQIEVPILFRLDGKGGAYYQVQANQVQVKK